MRETHARRGCSAAATQLALAVDNVTRHGRARHGMKEVMGEESLCLVIDDNLIPAEALRAL